MSSSRRHDRRAAKPRTQEERLAAKAQQDANDQLLADAIKLAFITDPVKNEEPESTADRWRRQQKKAAYEQLEEVAAEATERYFSSRRGGGRFKKPVPRKRRAAFEPEDEEPYTDEEFDDPVPSPRKKEPVQPKAVPRDILSIPILRQQLAFLQERQKKLLGGVVKDEEQKDHLGDRARRRRHPPAKPKVSPFDVSRVENVTHEAIAQGAQAPSFVAFRRMVTQLGLYLDAYLTGPVAGRTETLFQTIVEGLATFELCTRPDHEPTLAPAIKTCMRALSPYENKVFLQQLEVVNAQIQRFEQGLSTQPSSLPN